MNIIYSYIYIYVYIYIYTLFLFFMYKMSSREKELTQIRKAWSIYKRILDLQNLCDLATAKIKSYCNTKCPTKDQVKKYKREMSQWIDNDNSVYVQILLLI